MRQRTPTVSVSIPEPLIQQVDRWIGRRGYRSRAEIVKEALRFRLEQLREHKKKVKGI